MTVIYFAWNAYEVIMMLEEAMVRSGIRLDPSDISRHLLGMKDFHRLLGSSVFDDYGDSIREKALYIIKENQYVTF